MTQTIAEIISIGDELLNGQTTNTNATWIASELDNLSIKTNNITTIGDTKVAIINALATAQQRAQLVILTGGLGPTKDDITKKQSANTSTVNSFAMKNITRH